MDKTSQGKDIKCKEKGEVGKERRRRTPSAYPMEVAGETKRGSKRAWG